jgi:hypothetical protein
VNGIPDEEKLSGDVNQQLWSAAIKAASASAGRVLVVPLASGVGEFWDFVTG